jgi:hypothetical protein
MDTLATMSIYDEKSICNKMSNIENILTLPSINQCFLFRFTEDAYIKRDQSEDELLNDHPTISESNITPLYKICKLIETWIILEEVDSRILLHSDTTH